MQTNVEVTRLRNLIRPRHFVRRRPKSKVRVKFEYTIISENDCLLCNEGSVVLFFECSACYVILHINCSIIPMFKLREAQ